MLLQECEPKFQPDANHFAKQKKVKPAVNFLKSKELKSKESTLKERQCIPVDEGCYAGQNPIPCCGNAVCTKKSDMEGQAYCKTAAAGK